MALGEDKYNSVIVMTMNFSFDGNKFVHNADNVEKLSENHEFSAAVVEV